MTTARAPPRQVADLLEGQTDGVVPFVCDPCQRAEHEQCPGGSWCDCQHRSPSPAEPATGPPGE